MRRPPSTKQLQAAVDRFNKANPIGSKIRVWKGAVHDGPGIVTEVKEPGAYILGGHTAVVKIPGDAIALTHVAPAE